MSTWTRRASIPPGTPVAREYAYVDERGNVLYMKRRYEWHERGERRKAFTLHGLLGYDHGRPRWDAKLDKGTRRVPYHLDKLRAAVAAGSTVYLVDGEKDVETLEAAGHAATTSPLGNMMSWRGEYAGYFYGAKRVAVIADNDASGQGVRDAWRIADSLRLLGVPVEVVRVPVGKDVTDFAAAGAP